MKKEKIKILFACVENSFRSQIAEGVAKRYFSDYIEAYSAGSKPIQNINPKAKEVLEEIGFDTSSLKPKGFFDLPDIEFDYLITMGCKEVCPIFPSKKSLNWELEDIKDQPIEKVRELRELIKNRIERIIDEEFKS
ncbi:MAG: Protein tyrosine phosphatase [candidate division TA06 bacterium 32_111]|uniref:Protein tyrosine phosphatase n=2 Tax=Bacteria candidate phyla TaxID=1783234 RepID=A0A124G0C1_UNCT6|nr:MAG: Protein tyrosine phosphatase [candidate division TA06 bacterium 32_111]KUK86907.1 MAG: Protein tyrosine phosphatase [candidate division TA06 bacterium 34_109]HAF07230.1 low molecular weight phosphatase family protein [candidate division WOR-3 bacterium]HCP16656.1 low molecular weight phosphatase family protein [candidate division WOR-3 bacterium]